MTAPTETPRCFSDVVSEVAYAQASRRSAMPGLYAHEMHGGWWYAARGWREAMALHERRPRRNCGWWF